MSIPVISIVMPAFNRAQWLPLSIGSVQCQTFTDWELIVIDDRSTDATAEEVRKLAAEDCRIRLVANTHAKGPSGARNQGLEVAQGKYIAYLDSDDEWEPFHLERMVYYLEKYPARIDVMNANVIRRRRETGEVYGSGLLDLDGLCVETLEEALVIEPQSAFDKQLRKRVLLTQTMVGKREVMTAVLWDEALPAATDCWHCLELTFRGVRMGHLQSFHCNYWAHNDNLTNCGKSHSAERMVRVQQGFVMYWERALRLPLTGPQRQFAKSRLAARLAWHLGYNAHEALGQYAEARRCYWQAVKLCPREFQYWRRLAAGVAKPWLRSVSRGLGLSPHSTAGSPAESAAT